MRSVQLESSQTFYLSENFDLKTEGIRDLTKLWWILMFNTPNSIVSLIDIDIFYFLYFKVRHPIFHILFVSIGDRKINFMKLLKNDYTLKMWTCRDLNAISYIDLIDLKVLDILTNTQSTVSTLKYMLLKQELHLHDLLWFLADFLYIIRLVVQRIRNKSNKWSSGFRKRFSNNSALRCIWHFFV